MTGVQTCALPILRRLTQAEADGLAWKNAPGHGETPIIAPGARLGWPHAFRLDRIDLGAGETLGAATPAAPEVLFVHAGVLTVGWADGEVALASGDTMTVPIGMARTLASAGGCVAYRVCGRA